MAKSEEFGAPFGIVVDLPGGAQRSVAITNPNKVMFPSVIGPSGTKEERTKLDLARYYVAAAFNQCDQYRHAARREVLSSLSASQS